jgi:hypothetical protein
MRRARYTLQFETNKEINWQICIFQKNGFPNTGQKENNNSLNFLYERNITQLSLTEYWYMKKWKSPINSENGLWTKVPPNKTVIWHLRYLILSLTYPIPSCRSSARCCLNITSFLILLSLTFDTNWIKRKK